MSQLQGRAALVTGASRGIGRVIAETLAREGATVVCAARSAPDLDLVVDGIQARGGKAAAIVCDVTSDEAVRRLQDEAARAAAFIDIVVNNAGIYEVGAFQSLGVEAFRRVMETNLMGTVRVTSAFLPPMLEQRTGRIINIASTAGKSASRFQSAYNSSKHAVVGLTKCLALETASMGVRVNAICPGFVETDLLNEDVVDQLAPLMGVPPAEVMSTLMSRVPIGRFVTPKEVAELALYLAGPASDGITGQAITLSGGF